MKTTIVTASLLDRIFWEDDDPRYTAGAVRESAYIASAVRDIQDLLNTRNFLREVEPSARQKKPHRLVDSSVIMVGVPDFSSLSLARSADRERLSYEITYAIETFDRRFSNVRVELVDVPGTVGSLSFVIRARLKVAEAFTEVGLQARYESSRMHFTVAPLRS